MMKTKSIYYQSIYGLNDLNYRDIRYREEGHVTGINLHICRNEINEQNEVCFNE